MDLIERYLQAVGRELPQAQREDILTELRSSLYDELDRGEGADGAADEEAAVRAIRAMGPPQKVAAAYFPAGQYLIGPALYPLFLLVLKIVITSVIGAQLLVVALSVADGRLGAVDEFWGIAGSLPAAFGFVAAVFWLLQRFDIKPATAEAFDPRALPPLEADPKLINRFGQLVGLVFKVGVLVIVARFANRGGFADAGGMFENPVIDRYFPWIAIAMLAGIVLDIVLLWRGRWQFATRLGLIGVDVFSLGVLFVLIRGHDAWLAAVGGPGLFGDLRTTLRFGDQTATMAFWRLILACIAIGIAVEALFAVYQLLRTEARSRGGKAAGLISANR